MHSIKRLKNKAITLFVSAAVALSMLGAAFTFTRTAAFADIEEVPEFEPTSLGLSNTNFDSSSGSYPAAPSSWTGANKDEGTGNVISGVIDLTASSYFGANSGNKAYKLDQYPEYADEKSMPQTIFGTSSEYSGTDAKTLLVNTAKNAEVAYTYKSGDMTFAANSFYRVSAWVKTGDFAADTGATIKLSGLGENCSFLNINTVKNLPAENGIPVLTKENKYGWVKYTFYVRTSAALSKTVNLELGIGDAVQGNDEDPTEIMPRPASGYAFFDTVNAEQISAYTFAAETQHFVKTERTNVFDNGMGTAIAIDLNETDLITNGTGDDAVEIGTFSDGFDNWKTNIYYDENSEDHSYAGAARSLIYNSENLIEEDNIYGLTQNPSTPFGKTEYSVDGHPMFAGNNGNILMITTYNGKEFKNAAYGVASPEVKIERFKYYRFSVWVKGDSIEGGNGISLAVKGKANGANRNKKITEYTGLTGDSAATSHYGWKEQIIYIQGSMLNDYTVSFELWLGAPTAQSAGIAMFDNVTFTELSYSDYKAMSAADGGNVFSSLDSAAEDTGIANGTFGSVGDMDDEIKFPLPVAEWSYLTPDKVETRGFSKNEVDTRRAVHGILPTDSKTFDEIANSGKIPGVTNPAHIDHTLNNVLLLSSISPTAFCYQSPSVTLAVDKANKLTVDMAVNGVSAGSYGASLVLKTTDGDVISTIENITATPDGTFKTYTFYLAAPLAEKTVYVEIWLGLNDRYDNTRKLSDGNIYVSKVALTEWTAADENTPVSQEYDAQVEKYKKAIASSAGRKNLDFGVYSFSTPSLDYYDFYSYESEDGYGIPYSWNRSSVENGNAVISGLVNTDSMKPNLLYAGFDKKDLTGNMLYIYNTDKTRTVYTCNNELALVANTYYRIDVTVKVRVSDEVRTDKTSIGANIKLTGTSAEFENIKDTTTLVSKNDEESRDYETFKTYSFYIATGEAGGNVGLEIAFGGTERNSYIQGRLIVGNITMTAIDNLDFENAQKDTNNKMIKAVQLSENAADDDDNSGEAVTSDIQWWIIPTVIFSAALLAAVIIIVVVRVRDRIKRKKKVTYSSEYDRNDVMRDIERLQAQKDDDEETVDNADKPAETDYDDEEREEAQTELDQPVEAEPEIKEKEQTQEKSDDLDD